MKFSGSYDDFDYSPKTRERGKRQRRRFDDEPMRRGRLTEEERTHLSALREEPEPQPLPDNADRWSTWDSGERGPVPRPAWVVTELAAVDHELGSLKTGKEADVHLLRRSVPGTQRETLLAAKRYRDGDHRLFHRDSGYLEGRRMRRSRESRAMTNRTSSGRGMIAQQWAVAEFGFLSSLFSAGISVPYPVQRVGTEVLLEFIGTEDGEAAPRLANLRPDPDELGELWSQLVSAMIGLAEQGLTHGDLSAYNVLVDRYDGGPRLVLIDLPQAVDLAANPLGTSYLRRDVHTITKWFGAQGLRRDKSDPDGLFRLLGEIAHML